MNSLKIAAALRVLALAFEAPAETADLPPAQPTETAAPAKRGRGRPVKGEETAAAVPAQTAAQPVEATTAVPASVEADPFAAPVPAAPTATLDEVRTALKALAAAVDQATALGVLKTAGGAANLTDLKPEKYGAVVHAAMAALPPIKTEPSPVEADPFATPASTAPAAAAPTIDDVRAEVIASSKRTSQDTVAKVVMDAGGKAAGSDGVFKPSWKALPESKYAEVLAALKALPTTK